MSDGGGSNRRPRPSPPWNASQRAVLVALLSVLVAYLALRLWLHPSYVSDPQPALPPRAMELQDRIDPNTADAATLAALPMIGEKRARDIVAYREAYAAQHPGELAYKRREDLTRIKGVGAAILQATEPFLIFPTTPTSKPGE